MICERCGKDVAGIHTCSISAEHLAKLERVYFAAKETILDNLHLADGDQCTLQALRDAAFPDGVPE